MSGVVANDAERPDLGAAQPYFLFDLLEVGLDGVEDLAELLQYAGRRLVMLETLVDGCKRSGQGVSDHRPIISMAKEGTPEGAPNRAPGLPNLSVNHDNR